MSIWTGVRYGWFCFWWRWHNRTWEDCRHKDKQMERDWNWYETLRERR